MKIESARELKNQLLKAQVQPLVASLQRVSALAIGAADVATVDPVQRTIALGISRKGKGAFRLAVRIQRRDLEDSPQIDAIRKKAKGEIDVRYVGRIAKRTAPWNQSRQRPLLIGSSIGHFRITAGTLGCFVKRRSGGQARILSNNHVLADENAGKKGDAIIQPGRFDKGKKGKDTVGTLDKAVKLIGSGINYVDAAIASLRTGIQFDSRTLKGLGTLTGSLGALPDVGDKVAKVGRTTDVTRGRVTAFELDNVVVAYDIGNLRFDEQIEIEGAGTDPFSQGGDSGSVIVNSDKQPVALLFAGGDQGGSNGKGLTYANPIDRVFAELEVDLLF